MNIIYAIIAENKSYDRTSVYIIYIESGASGISVRTVRQGMKKTKEREKERDEQITSIKKKNTKVLTRRYSCSESSGKGEDSL